jgi:NADPH:quinone reductase-like Zn-dependent oxidoreductase
MVIRHDAAVPELWPKAVLVRTAAVAVNQVDAKLLDYSPAPGAVIGHDFSGTVVALGESARAAGRLAVGNRVAGLVHGMNKLRPDVGAFAEYVAADADLVLQIPDAMSFEEAATLGVGVATAALALCGELGVPVPGQEEVEGNTDSGQYEGEFVLVVGGSSASGTRALQMLKM